MQEELSKQTMDLVVRAKGLEITDPDSLRKAGDIIGVGNDLIKKIREFFGPIKSKAHAAWKSLCDAESEELRKIVPVVDLLKAKVGAYMAEERRKREEAEAAARRAEMERKRLEEEAIRKAQEAEARAKLAKDEEARRAARAEADRILARAAEEEKTIAPAPVIPEAPEIRGLAMRENWDFEIVDEAAIPREYLVPDEVKIRRVVRIMKDKTAIPGIRAFNRPTMQRIGTRSGHARPS
jgi:hypothetical protein